MNQVSRPAEREAPVLTFGSLVTRRILIPSERTNLMAVDKYFLVRLLKSHVGRIHFDEAFYFARYPDIKQAVDAGKVPSAKSHYLTDGYYEHRLPYEIVVDADWYLQQYPDVQKAVAAQQFESAQMHFEEAGYREGREPYAGFTLLCDTSPVT